MAAMFQKAAEHVAKVSGEKTLHPVADLNTAERFKPLCIVERKKSFWFWKKPSMSPTFVKINDLLSQDIDLSANRKSFTLLKDFEEQPTLDVSGSVSAKILSEANVELNANEKLSLVLKLGDIEKNEVPWGKLSDSLRDNPVRRDHPLYLRAKQNPDISFCVVIGSVCTKGDGVLKEDSDVAVSTDDTVKVTVVDLQVHTKASVEKKTAYSYTIPSDTVLAYSSVEFSISPVDDLITLHGTYDTLDDAETPAIFSSPEEIDSADGSGIEPVVDIIKHEMRSFTMSEKFEELREAFKLVLRKASNNMLILMHSLLDSAVQYLENKNSDNFVLMSTLNHLIEDKIELPWKEVLNLLGFSIPEDVSDGNAFVVLPGTEDGTLIKTCLALVDSIMDLTVKARELLCDITIEHKNIILNIIEMQLRSETISDQSVKSSTLDFLKECGFVVADDDKTIDFPGYDTDSLLDAYIVIHVLFTSKPT